MLQILGDGEIASLSDSYRRRYGNVVWDDSDHLHIGCTSLPTTRSESCYAANLADAIYHRNATAAPSRSSTLT